MGRKHTDIRAFGADGTRSERLGLYMIENDTTIRAAASAFGDIRRFNDEIYVRAADDKNTLGHAYNNRPFSPPFFTEAYPFPYLYYRISAFLSIFFCFSRRYFIRVASPPRMWRSA